MFLSIVYENRPGGCRGRPTDLKNAGRTGCTLCLTVPYDIVQPTQIEGDSNICVAAIIVEDVTVGVTAAVIVIAAAEMEMETAMEMEIMETAAAAETAGIPAPVSATGLTAEAITTAIGQAIMMPPLAEESPERRKRQRRELAAAARTKECGCGRGGQRLS